MSRRLIVWLAAAFLVFPLVSGRGVPLPIRNQRDRGHSRNTAASRIVGQWRVKFANGVTQVCNIRRDGTASVAEPLRQSGGKWTANGGLVTIVYDDDRVERWKREGKQFVVGHWFPGSQFPNGPPVRGVARRAP